MLPYHALGVRGFAVHIRQLSSGDWYQLTPYPAPGVRQPEAASAVPDRRRGVPGHS